MGVGVVVWLIKNADAGSRYDCLIERGCIVVLGMQWVYVMVRQRGVGGILIQSSGKLRVCFGNAEFFSPWEWMWLWKASVVFFFCGLLKLDDVSVGSFWVKVCGVLVFWSVHWRRGGGLRRLLLVL